MKDRTYESHNVLNGHTYQVEMLRWVVCPKCGSKSLVLREMWKDHVIEFCQEPDTGIEAEGILEPGNPSGVQAQCNDCEHTWKVRGVTQITELREAYEWAQ